MVGAHLLLKLVSEEKKVRAIYRQENLKKVLQVFTYYHSDQEAEQLFSKIEWHKADILDIPQLSKAFEGIDTVYHFAAMVSFNVNDEKKLRKVNIEGTANIVNLGIAYKVKKLCYVSSIATLNQNLNSTIISEQSYWNPEIKHSSYAISKYGAEIEVWRGTQEGLDAVIINPGVILGPGDANSGSGLIFSKIEKGLSYSFPQVTGFVGVKDVVDAMLQLMNSSITNEQFIVVAENKSFTDVLKQIAAKMDKNPPKNELKPWMFRVAWLYQIAGSLFGGKRQLRLNSLGGFFEKSYYSSEKIEKQLNFAFRPIDEAIEETVGFFKTKK